MLNGSKIVCPNIRKVAGTTMEKDGMVRVINKCPYCGATNLYRRIRKGGYHCNKCKLTFDDPTTKKI
jgi:ribosomal protein L37AE/L43A